MLFPYRFNKRIIMLSEEKKKEGWVEVPDNAKFKVLVGAISPYELKRRLERLNPDLGMIIYGGDDVKRHQEMCSVTYKNEHLYSMLQTKPIPLYPYKGYGIVDKFSGKLVPRLSVWQLGRKLQQLRIIRDPRDLV